MTVRALIRKHAASLAATATPTAISSAVLRDLHDSDDVREALRVALPYLVRDEIRKGRHHAIGAPDPRGRYAWSEPEAAELPPPADLRQVRARREAGRAGFDAAQAKREREAALLATRVATASGWKLLGECTIEDLRAMAHECEDRALENSRRAAAYDRLAQDMEARGIARVADYPEVQAIREVFAPAA